MGTKLNPGKYDVYGKLAPDEPFFTLRAKDPLAPVLVELWAALRETQYGGPVDKFEEAKDCARLMRLWRSNRFRQPLPIEVEMDPDVSTIERERTEYENET